MGSKRKFLVLPLLALLAACGKSYDMPAGEVSEKLSHISPPMMALSGMVGNYMTTRTGDGDVHWTLIDGNGSALIRITADVEASGDNAATVSVSADPPDNSKNARIAKNMEENPEIVSLLESAMREQIDAKLMNRPFNMAAIQHQLMAATIKQMPKIQGQMQEAANHFKEMDREMEADRFAAGVGENESGYASDN